MILLDDDNCYSNYFGKSIDQPGDKDSKSLQQQVKQVGHKSSKEEGE